MASCYLGFIFFCMAAILSTYASPLTQNSSYLSFDEAFHIIFGNQNVRFLDKYGYLVQISLDEHTGSGFKSQQPFLHAYFSASIKLPANYTAGVVVTFYTSNSDEYKDTHDELDFEFLGHTNNDNWVIQTNLYGNGSVSRGREERYHLPFDPSIDFHTYSILWTENTTIFYVDYLPIREVQRVEAMGGDYPSKPMSLYATIWDGSSWATGGGKHKVDYTYAPFNSQYSKFVLEKCSDDQSSQQLSRCDNGLTPEERNKMKMFRTNYMIYSYCNDKRRYPTPLPECTHA